MYRSFCLLICNYINLRFSDSLDEQKCPVPTRTTSTSSGWLQRLCKASET